LDKSGKPIKHPSWRVYKAVQDCGLDATKFGLKDITPFYPYQKNDELTDELIKALKDPSYEDTTFEVKACLELFLNVMDRQLIEGMLLNNKSVSEICQLLDCSESFVLTYKSLFFDTSVFKNHVEKLVYVRQGTAGNDAVAKREFNEKGEEYFKAKLGLTSDKLSVDKVLLDTFAACYLALRKNAETDDIGAQEIAQGWGNLMVKIAAQLAKGGGKDMSIEDLIIQLQTTPPPQKSIEDLK
jgi:hypothetical protein